MKFPKNQNPATSTSTPVNQGPLFGVIIGLLFLALVLILAGLVIWNYLLTPAPVILDNVIQTPPNLEPESTTAQAQVEAASVLSTSNELYAIEADLMSTDLSNLESEIVAIDILVESPNTETSAP